LLLLLLDFGLGQLTSYMSIITYYAGFKKPTILKAQPSICGMAARTTMPGRLKHFLIK
jgi:hypothetical protein